MTNETGFWTEENIARLEELRLMKENGQIKETIDMSFWYQFKTGGE